MKLLKEEILRALDESGVTAKLVPAHHGQAASRPGPGIWYELSNEIIPVAKAIMSVIGTERWDELMRVAQIDNQYRGRVLYFPGAELA